MLMTLSLTCLFLLMISLPISLIFQILFYDWMSAHFLSLNPGEIEFQLLGHPQPLAKLDHPIISLADDVTFSLSKSARNLDVKCHILF
jgi:hypothetical protein